MTQVLTDVEAPSEEVPEREVEAAGTPAPAASAVARRDRASFLSVGTALTILGALLLGLVLDASVIGRVRHDRDRQTAYAHLRYDLANATAPVGALDVEGNPVAAGSPVAILEISSIGVREVVSYGTTSSILMSGPGLRRDTVLPGQVGSSVILGRRALFGGPFRYIDQLRKQDVITVTTGQGVSQFRVVDVRRAGDEIPPEFIDARATLMLATSEGSAYAPEDVLRVDAVLLDPEKALPAGPVTRPVAEDRLLAGEKGAWVPLVFWGQALVIAAVTVTWLRSRWGVRQAWLVGVPVLTVLGLAIADTAFRLLPNVM